MSTYQNTDVSAHVWQNLVNAETGRTLELEPGGRAEVLAWSEPRDGEGHVTGPAELVEPDGDLPYLKPVVSKGAKPKTTEAEPAAPTEE